VFQKVIWLSLAGACGTVSRFALCEAAAKFKVAPVPLGTFAVNIIGSFLFGFIYASADRRLNITPDTRAIILVGFMGAFTTFSAFAFETARMLKASQWVFAAGNIVGQVTLGIFALGIGILLGRTL
jgi:fluoride exporter